MLRFLVGVYLAAGCGFGFGAVDGPSKEYAFDSGDGAFYQDSSGTHIDGNGQRWRRGAGTLVGHGQLGGGASIGFRRGISWAQSASGQSVDGGRSADYYLQGYWGALSLGLGMTTESGTVETTPGQTTEVGYEGLYVEPA